MSTTETTASTETKPAPGTYTVDAAHSTVGFSTRHLLTAKVRGQFTEFEGTVVVGETPEASSVTATVQAKSIATHQEQRDAHLRTGDFLEADTYPTLTLVSKRVTPKGAARYDLVADLTIHGVTKEVVFDLEYLGTSPGLRPGTTVVGFEASASIDRRDFGVNFNAVLETGGLVVANKVDIELSIEAFAQIEG